MSLDVLNTARKRLDSWKEIAEYLGRDVRTAMRWEQDLQLPVHRVPGGQRRGVFAISDEIDAWLVACNDQLPEVCAVPTIVESPPQRLRRSFVLAFAGAGLVVAIALLLVFRLPTQTKNKELTFRLPDKTFRFVATGKILLRGSAGNIVAADLNNDGWDDLVVGGAPTNRLAVLLNHGGVFGSPIYYEGCSSSSGPSVGDFDGDGNPDIAVACIDSHQVQVWWGDGKGGFGAPITLDVGKEPRRCSAGDFNRDGIMDFVVDASGGGPVIVFSGHRDRTFTRMTLNAGTNPTNPFIADVDGDGLLDIALACSSNACHNVTLLRGLGDGTFRPAESIAGIGIAWTVFVADFTGDGILDIFAGSINGDASFFSGTGKGKFLPAKLALHTASGDTSAILTSQGRNYILDLQLYPAQFRMLSFDAQGNVIMSNNVQVDGIPRLLAMADFNHDGRQEGAVLFIDRDSSYVTIYLQK